MRLGIDLDNTIVRYDGVFHVLGRERGVIPDGVAISKTAVRDLLRQTGQEAVWTELQGEAYGPRMGLAEPFEGVVEFLAQCHAHGVEVHVVSHRTRTPYAGPPYDLHRSARDWLAARGVLDSARTGLTPERVHLELSKAGKLARIGELACAAFIDDLPEFLAEADFPRQCRRVLFDPAGAHGPAGVDTFARWSEAFRMIGAGPSR